MLFLGIRREDRYSPNRIADDKAIFDAVCSRLKTPENMIFRMNEDEFGREGAGDFQIYDAVLNMCRSDMSLTRLAGMEKSGVQIINRPESVLNCRRTVEVRLLQDAGTAFVRSRIVSDGVFPSDWDCFPCWLKRGNAHAIDADDVRFVANRAEAELILEQMMRKDVSDAVLQEHVPGKIVKFYGVGRNRLFRYRFLESVSDGKFGLEAHNDLGTAEINEAEFHDAVADIAEILGVDVYGGDAVVTPQGSVVIVDFNDWPSFFSCRNEAADAIAELVLEKCGE